MTGVSAGARRGGNKRIAVRVCVRGARLSAHVMHRSVSTHTPVLHSLCVVLASDLQLVSTGSKHPALSMSACGRQRAWLRPHILPHMHI